MKPNQPKLVRDIIIIILGILIYAFGFTVFILPHHIVIGGMTGFGTLVHYASGQTIPVSVAMYASNALLLLGGWRVLGKWFVIRTVFGMTALSLAIGSVEGYWASHAPLITSAPMSVGLGSVLLGIGIGMYLSHHGTCGGTDIVAAIAAKRSNISMGRVIMIVDITITALSFLLPFDGDMEARVQARAETIIYGWLAIFIYSTLADRYMGQGEQTMQFLILSDRWNDIAQRVTHETGRGVTTWQAKGYWTGTDRTMIMLWCRKYDVAKITTIAHEVDPDAYITCSSVRSVYGNGFNSLAPKSKTKESQKP